MSNSHEELPLRSITLDSVGHWFVGTNVLFEGVSATLAAGTVTGVCGPSGCGKTTLLTLLAGWEQPRAGSIRRVGIGSIAWVFQNPHGVPRRTALDHVAFPLLAKGRNRRQACQEALDLMRRFNLESVADRSYSSLSGGECQRLLLARALARDPDVLLVDEPTAQLDRASAETVNQCLTQVALYNGVVVVATHDPDTRAVCNQVIDLIVPSQNQVNTLSSVKNGLNP